MQFEGGDTIISFVSVYLQHIHALELAITAQEVSIPVYFAKYNEEFNEIVHEVANTEEDDAGMVSQRDSALSEIANSISANGYQVKASEAFIRLFIDSLIVLYL